MLVFTFILLTFAISLIGFLGVKRLPGAQSPETAIGLPCWLIMVWGPSLAAILLTAYHGNLSALMSRSFNLSNVPFEIWILTPAPLVLLVILLPFGKGKRETISLKMFAAMFALNLVLGPLGEELGWRGFMQFELSPTFGWLISSIIIGVVWFIWHTPMWMVESPISEISPKYFGLHCMAYSIIIGASFELSQGSIIPAILLHLTINLASNLASFAGFTNPNDWFRVSLIPYFVLAFLIGFYTLN